MTAKPPPTGSALPLVSVVVPVFDVEDQVGACLASLRAQVGVDLEVIVVDDGSTDASRARAEAAIAGDPRFRLIAQENRGLSAARNAGLDAARGDLVAFVDGDDRVMADYLWQMARALVEEDADWVACAIRFVGTDPGVPGHGTTHSAIHGAADLGLHPVPRRWPLSDWREVARHFPSAWNKLYRRELIAGLRFPEGTWFEDHGFYWRAAARTDHIVHLPQTLYLQTRGRRGQITAADDDRVLQQFDVIDDIAGVIAAGGKSHGAEALERIASRLVFERSTALRVPERRARFAGHAGRYLAERGLAYRTDWDPALARSWEIEMAGTLPLSVVIDATAGTAGLAALLDTLAAEPAPGRECLVCCAPATEAAAREACAAHPEARAVPGGRAAGLAAAAGRFVVFLAPGDTLAPGTLWGWVDTMLAQAAQFGVARFRLPGGGIHSGFLVPFDRDPAPRLTGPLDLPPRDALALDPELSAKCFERAFLATHGLAPGPGPRGAWAMVLGAALLAPRAAYMSHPGVAPDYAARPGVSARAMARDHDALVRALPAAAAARLPDGWRRRLFARALRDEIDRPRSRRARLRFVADAGAAVLARGLGGRGGAAGHDTRFDARLRRLMDPWGTLGAGLRGPRRVFRDLFRPAASAPPAPPEADLLAAPLGAHGTLRCRVHPARGAPAVLTLFDTDRVPVLRLSLEPGRAVLARRAAAGWVAERTRPLRLPPEGAEVAFAADGRHVEARVDETRIARLAAGTGSGGGDGLDRIAWIGIEGGAAAASLVAGGTAARGAADGTLHLDGRLQLSARVAGPDAPALRVAGTGDPPPLVARPEPGGWRLDGPLPGRVWRGVAPGGALELRLDGRDAAPLVLDRDGLVARLDALLAAPALAADPEAAMLAVEHVRFAGVEGRLAPRARRALSRVVESYGLDGYLWAEADTADAPERAAEGAFALSEAGDPDQAAVDAALARLAQALEAEPGRAAPSLMDDLALPAVPRRKLYLALSEVLAARDDDLAGLVRRARAEGIAPFVPGPYVWENGAILPFLLEEDRFDELRAALSTLADPATGWIVTAPLGWTLMRALARDDLPGAVRAEIAAGALDFLDARAGLYWERTPCLVLIRATVALLGAGGRLPPDLVDRARAVARRTYALSRPFWEAWDAAGGPDAALAPARAAFARIEAACDARRHGPPGPDAQDAVAAALGALRDAPCAVRAARDLLGPARRNGPPDPDGPAEALLRHMASPGASPAGDAGAARARAALPGFWDEVPHAPHYALQVRLGTWLARSDPALWTGSEPEWDDLGTIAGPDAGHLGIALGLRALALAKDGPAARGLLERLARWRDAQGAGAVEAAPAVLHALWSLGRRDTGPARAARTLFAGARLPPPPSVRDPAPGPFDTIVVVVSCRAHLETRIPALRAGWLGRLADRGVPHVVVTGCGDGSRAGDVVHLDAPDDYEGLPQKVLAAIAWVRDHTPHSHMLKIDDDCFLNVDEVLAAQSYARSDYHGRKLTRGLGQTDRAWHNAKSRSDRGRFELDRSPEPSAYADGGSGYALSRRAMEAALDAAAAPQGRRLIAASFMEDKMLGDLLSLAGIAVEGWDHRVTVRRRVHPDAIPVPAWSNGFDASAAAPVSVVHLDTHAAQAAAEAGLAAPHLTPKKLWPTFQDLRLGYATNALELVGDPARVDAVRAAPVAVIAAIRNEMFVLPRFLEHYRRLGVEAFAVADNGSQDGTLEYLAEQPDVAVFSADTPYAASQYGVAWQQALLALRPGRWSLVADADEFLVWQWPQVRTLPELLAEPDFAETDAARLFMLDMYPGGALSEARFRGSPFDEAGFTERHPFRADTPLSGPFTDGPTWTSALRHRLIPGSRATLFVAQKYALLRYAPWMRLSAGLHYVAGIRRARRELFLAHFKYNADFRRKARAEVARRQHFNDAEEYRAYLALASEGRDTIFEPDISVPWTDSAFVRARLG